MTMNMHRAFNSRMQAPMTLYTVAAGSYDADNNWVEGAKVASTVFGVITAGNKFSQFDEGISLHNEDGGARYSNYRNLYIKDTYTVTRGDKISFRGAYYNVLQESDEKVFGFASYILEKSEDDLP